MNIERLNKHLQSLINFAMLENPPEETKIETIISFLREIEGRLSFEEAECFFELSSIQARLKNAEDRKANVT